MSPVSTKNAAPGQQHVLAAGTPACAGCGALQEIKLIADILGKKTIFVNAAGCMTLLAVYPFTPFRGSWLYTSMASAPAGAQGVRDALDIMLADQRLAADEDLQVVVLAGDGSAGGMGLAATSGAMDRNLDVIFLCYDNEGYGNTGYQFSAATPHGVRTTTSGHGNPGQKKDLFAIWTAHQPAYAATICAAEPRDLARKVAKLKTIKGPRMLMALAPCPTNWHYEPSATVQVAKLAVQTGHWPLKEHENGRTRHTKIPKPWGERPLVEEYLCRQGRYSHLFSPRRQETVIAEIQARTDHYWQEVADSDEG